MAPVTDTFPDYFDIPKAQSWLDHVLEIAAKLDPSDAHLEDMQCFTVASYDENPYFSHMADPAWRSSLTGLFAADWACYHSPADRVEFERLHSVLSVFPQGFTLSALSVGDVMVPVGYTAWYPIEPAIYEALEETPHIIKHRGFIRPLPALPKDDPAIYLFNYSIVPSFKKTPFSKAMLAEFAQSVRASGAGRMAAITVSPEGRRVARRFGMEERGEIIFAGEKEQIYTSSQA